MSSIAFVTTPPIPASVSLLVHRISITAKRQCAREARPGNISGNNSGKISSNISRRHNTVHSHPFPNSSGHATNDNHSGNISGKNFGKIGKIDQLSPYSTARNHTRGAPPSAATPKNEIAAKPAGSSRVTSHPCVYCWQKDSVLMTIQRKLPQTLKRG